MDPSSIDQSYDQLVQQSQQTTQLIQALAVKLQAASTAGDPNAREWLLDLKEITLGVQQEQGETSLLLQNIHSMIDAHVQGAATQPQQAPRPSVGGGLQHFLGGGMARSIVSGAGFGIGDDIIDKIF